MARIRILHASINDMYYDVQALARMSYDEAKHYFEYEDKFGACCVEETVVDDTKPNEFTFHADGVMSGDSSDTMLNWCKVDCCY